MFDVTLEGFFADGFDEARLTGRAFTQIVRCHEEDLGRPGAPLDFDSVGSTDLFAVAYLTDRMLPGVRSLHIAPRLTISTDPRSAPSGGLPRKSFVSKPNPIWGGSERARSTIAANNREARNMRLTRPVQMIALCVALALPTAGRGQQVFHGDGATNDGAGGWTAAGAAAGQCMYCHRSNGPASDQGAYLGTGHKNMLKKVTANKPWVNSDGSALRTSDTPEAGSLYNSGSTFDWISGKITVGSGPDLPFPFANPALIGTQQDLFYIFGGWIDPSQLDTAWRGGFTGEQFASGNYDCARCHTAGYRFDDTGVEPTFGGVKISSADFSRVPTDFDPATGPTASWMQDGITCERCHVADNGIANHTASGAIATGIPSKPTGTAATALCMECHRTEIADPIANTITFDTGQFVQDGGGCSDGVSPDYATCLAMPGNTWSYAPFLDHPAGLSFLNSPHARFTGTAALNAQNSSDLSVNLSGTYSSGFVNADLSQGGCTTCHDPHQSFTQASALPLKKNCNDCHPLAPYILQSIRHPTGPGTPFPTGTAADIPGSCAVCHLTQGLHFFRISTDPNYSTFPTAAAFYAGQTTANTAPDGAYVPAVWTDVDLACGQCHVGSGTIGFAPVPGIEVVDKTRLAIIASGIHGPDVCTITSSSSGNGTILPAGAINLAPGGSQTYSIAPNAGYKINYVTVNGLSVGAVSSYTFSSVTTNDVIKADFVPITYAITVNQTANGTIAPYTYGGFTQGASQTYTVSPSAGYRVVDVSVDGVSQGAIGSYTFSGIQANHTITATYAANPSYTITVTQGPNGTVSPGTTTVLGGLSQAFTVTPSSGYVVSGVTVDGVSVGAVTSYGFYGVSGNHTITASFVNSYLITSSATSANGTISPAGSTTVPAGGSQTYSIAPNAGYKINYVTVNGFSVGAVSSYTFSNVHGNNAIKADFVPITYTITVNQTANGTVSPYTYGGFTQGATQTYKVSPNAGYHVVDVSVDGVSQGAIGSYTFSGIQANHTITATFGP
jgi:hypothetical protein